MQSQGNQPSTLEAVLPSGAKTGPVRVPPGQHATAFWSLQGLAKLG